MKEMVKEDQRDAKISELTQQLVAECRRSEGQQREAELARQHAHEAERRERDLAETMRKQLSVLEHDGDATLLELVLREGRNRQIRRTAGLLGHPVLDLRRIAIGGLELADLPEGRWRRLQADELVHEDGHAPDTSRIPRS